MSEFEGTEAQETETWVDPTEAEEDEAVTSSTEAQAVGDAETQVAEDVAQKAVNEGVTEVSEVTKKSKTQYPEGQKTDTAQAEETWKSSYGEESEGFDYPPASAYPGLKFLNPTVLYVLYWRSPKLSGTIFAVLLTFLLALLRYTLIQVVCLVFQSILGVSFGWRLLVALKQAVQKEKITNPFQAYLDSDLNTLVTKRQVESFSQKCREMMICEARWMVHVLAIEDFVDSLKFGIKLGVVYALAGCWSTLTLAIVGLLLMFSLPKLYENNQVKVDEVAEKLKKQMCAFYEKVKARLPMKKKVQ